MTETETHILRELTDLEAAIQRLPTAQPKPDLLAHFSRIEALVVQLPRGTAPDLLHYLHRKSYQKARLFLEGRDAENQPGICRQVK